MLNLDWLQAFACFAEHLNFTRAAKALNISQPALHTKVRKLSESLDVPLYLKKGRRLELTAEGRKVYDFATDLQRRCEFFASSLHSGDDHEPVTLASGKGAFLNLLGDGIHEFRQQTTPLLKLFTGRAEECVDAVIAGKAHLGVAVINQAHPPELEVTVLARVPFMAVMQAGHVLAGRETISLADLRGQDMIVPPVGRPHRHVLESLIDGLHVAVEADGWELMLHFVALGLGVAVVNGCCDLPSGTVARPFPALPEIRYDLFHRANWRAGKHRQALKECLLRQTQEWR